ncbi:hypothetical protein LZ012_03020 [Dechloromonas sp. XY25]|uniref:Uncharacterized protein n=1 Tax=Dechloromonas hankyongensis TaxID=2908002 RepID=A0ABS9JYP4_9RHOO|nr:hypothetical protein [Dechloromonas hankyongensis]MCG2575964.1 hypothetical protein [Dechloromonas hankyongensis]
MTRQNGLFSIAEAAELITAGHFMTVAGDETALRQLPPGHWLGGTIPYFMSAAGGVTARDQVYVHLIDCFATPPRLSLRSADQLPDLCRNAPENGYSLIIIPAFGECHRSFAENAPNYEDMYMKPLAGWIAGVHLDELGSRKPLVVLGENGEFAEDKVAVIDVELPAGRYAQVDIVNPFRPGQLPAIRFADAGFAAGACEIDGQPGNLAEFLVANRVDTRLPLVADYCGALVNVSIRSIDRERGTVEFYAPVFPGLDYRIAEPLADYVSAFQNALPPPTTQPDFACNCVLNYLYAELHGKQAGHIGGPMTFGEIGYQLLNQTMACLSVSP